MNDINFRCNRTKRAASYASTTLNALVLIDFTNACLFVHCDSVSRTCTAARTNELSDSVVRTCLSTLSTLFTYRRIDVCTVTAHCDSTELTSVLTCFTHTLLAVVCYYETSDRTLFTSSCDNLDLVIALVICRAFTLSETNSLTNNLSLFVYTATEAGLRTRA